MSDKVFVFDGGAGHWEYPDGRTEPFIVGKIPVEDLLRRSGGVPEEVPVADSPAVVYWNEMWPEDQATIAEMVGLPAAAAGDVPVMKDALARKAAEWDNTLSPEQRMSLAPDAVGNNPYRNVRFGERPA